SKRSERLVPEFVRRRPIGRPAAFGEEGIGFADSTDVLTLVPVPTGVGEKFRSSVGNKTAQLSLLPTASISVWLSAARRRPILMKKVATCKRGCRKPYK